MTGQRERSVVNGLVATCEDGARAFRLALKEVADRDLKQVFYDLSIERKHTAAELRKLMLDLGGKPKESGSTVGLAMRVYADLKAALSPDEARAILEELERSEDRTLGRFRSALQAGLPPGVEEVVYACQDEVLASRQKVGALRHGTTAGRS